MGYRPTSKLEWAALWSLFILPAINGCVVWAKQPQYPVEFAYMSWMFAAAFAIILMYVYHHRSSDDEGDRDGGT